MSWPPRWQKVSPVKVTGFYPQFDFLDRPLERVAMELYKELVASSCDTSNGVVIRRPDLHAAGIEPGILGSLGLLAFRHPEDHRVLAIASDIRAAVHSSEPGAQVYLFRPHRLARALTRHLKASNKDTENRRDWWDARSTEPRSAVFNLRKTWPGAKS